MTTAQPQGYLALPRGVPGKGVLLLHPWWGLNETIKGFAERLAGDGFVVFAPDLFGGEVATTVEEAERLGAALDARYEEAQEQVAEAARWLAERAGGNGRLAVIGFSLGAYYGLQVATAVPELIDKVVVFYGSGGEDFGAAQAAFMGHFAGDDPYEPAENVAFLRQALEEAGRPVTFHVYEGTGHWFCEPDRPAAYDEAAAELAWSRTRAFLAE